MTRRKEIVIAIAIFLVGFIIGFMALPLSVRTSINRSDAVMMLEPAGPNCQWWEDTFDGCGGGWGGFSCRLIVSATAEAIGCESLL